MKKNKLYTVNKHNRPAFMPYYGYSNSYKTGGEIINGITDKLGGIFGGDKLSKTAGSLIGAAGTAVGGVANKVLSGGLNSGAGNAVANIGGTVGGLISNVNPLLGGIVSAGTGIIGGGINALFGTKVDKEKLAAVNSDIARGRNFVSKAGTFEDIKGPEAFMTDTNVHSGGLLVGGNARRKNAALRKDLTDAALFADRSVDNNINNIWGDMVNDALYNYSAFGGPLDSYSGALGLMQNDKYIDAINNRSDAIMGKNNALSNPQNYFGDGGGIHIKKANKGKFTAQANRAGMGVQEYASHVLANKEDYPAATVKRANFAHVFGGRNYAFGGELGTNGTDWTNGLLYVDAGGTHQQNPLGGVPVGFDQNGTPNLVEEGETIWNDYVFSNRIKVPKAMFHTLGLGGAMKKNRLTFADASKKLAKESEQRPNDPISMAGLEASLSKLAAVQEAERMKKQMRESVGLENMAAYGGPLGNVFAGPGDRANIIKSIPKDVTQFRGNIVNWLRNNPQYWNLDDDTIKNIAEEAFNSAEQERRKTAILDYYGNPVTKTDSVMQQMMLDNPGTIGRFYSPAFSEFINKPVFNTSEANVKDYIRKAMRQGGLDFEEAYSLMGGSRVGSNDREKYQAKQRMKEELESEFKNSNSSNKDSSAQQNTNNDLETQQPEQLEAQAAQPLTQNDGLDNFLAAMDNTSTLPSGENLASVAQRNNVNNGVALRGAGDIPSATGYSGTSGIRGGGNAGVVGNRNTGFTRDMAFVSSLDDMFNGTYGFTPSNGAQYIPYTGMSEAEVREIENDPRFQSWTNRVNDNFYNEKDVEVQNYLRQLDKAAGGNHLFDTNGKLRSDAKDYYNRARTQNHLMGWYHLTPLFEKAAQAANTQASGYVIGDDGKLVSKEDYLNVDRATSPGWVSPEVPDRIESPQRENPVNEKRPLLPTWMRYAPVFGGAAGVLGDLLGLTNKPDYTYADRLEAAANAAGYAPQVGYKPIGDYERYTPFDRLFYANQLQANARGTDRALANTSSPSRAAGLLANAYNTNNALGNLYRQGDEYNLAQYQQVKDFNRRTNMFNSQMGLEADIANARYRQAAKNYQMEGLGRAAALRDSIDQRVGAARSANLTNFFNSLGNIGRENFTFNQINQDPSRSYGYTTPWKAEIGYWPKEFDSYIDKEVQRRMEEERKKTAETQKVTQPASGAYGGKLKRNKK